MPIASGEHHPENRGVVNLTQEGALHEHDQHCQSAASTYVEDMIARKLNPHTQRSHIYSCKRLAAGSNARPIRQRPTTCVVFSSTSSRAVRASVTAIGS